jgi:uncharacterized membrane protein (UPF0127 family)
VGSAPEDSTRRDPPKGAGGKSVGLIIAATVAVAALIGMIAIIVLRRDNSDTGSLTFAKTTRAAQPFHDFDEARIAIDGRCQYVLVASTLSQRVDGLRNVDDLGLYQGMVFAFPNDSDAAFTMADTPMPLAITWYDARGQPVDHTTMEPCKGSDATCPEYESRKKFRYALEQRTGGAPAGTIGPCAA